MFYICGGNNARLKFIKMETIIENLKAAKERCSDPIRRAQLITLIQNLKDNV